MTISSLTFHSQSSVVTHPGISLALSPVIPSSTHHSPSLPVLPQVGGKQKNVQNGAPYCPR